MSVKTVAAIVAVLPIFLLAPASHAAPPTVQPTVSPTAARPMPKVKVLTALTMKNVGTVPGEKRTYEAVLTTKTGANPLAGKKVTFRIEGKNGTTVPNNAIVMGDDTTDTAGKAKVEFSLPELAQGNYALKASYAGDDDTVGSNVESILLVVKAITKIELSNLIWGTYKNEPGAPYGTIGIKLVRQSDNQTLAKALRITVNGNSWTLNASGAGSGYHQVVLQPMNAASWNVKVQFEGDDYAIATGAERTYTKPN